MKGLIEHIISEGDLVLREIERDVKGVEAPFLLEQFREWLQKNGIQGAVKSYPSFLKGVDKLITGIGNANEDFYSLVQDCFEYAVFDKLPIIFDEYEREMEEWTEWAKTANDDDSRPSHFRDMLSALRSYRQFIEETAKNRKAGTDRLQPAQTAKKLFMQDEFAGWLQYTGQQGRSSIGSTVSRIKSLNRDFISKLIPGKTIDILALLPKFIGQDKTKTAQLLDKIESRVNKAVNTPEATGIHPVTLRNMRRAFTLYAQFIKETINGYDATSLAVTAPTGDNETGKAEFPIEAEETECFEYDNIESTFRFRLLTQDRISNNLAVFFPISFIASLFKRHDKLAGLGIIDSDANATIWLNRWADDCIANITVITEKGEFILADIDMMEIDTQAKSTTVLLPDGQKTRLLTETHQGKVVPMEAGSINSITIDHTPQIAEILNSNARKLPALSRITEIMRRQARKNRIKTDSKHLPQIGKTVFENIGMDQLIAIIPQLKKDLMLIRDKSELKLMEMKYNLRKK